VQGDVQPGFHERLPHAGCGGEPHVQRFTDRRIRVSRPAFGLSDARMRQGAAAALPVWINASRVVRSSGVRATRYFLVLVHEGGQITRI